jgi:arginyl-tRNA synthetase
MIALLEALIAQVLSELGYEYPADTLVTEPPHHVEADFAVNVALQVAKATKGNPREIAQAVHDKLMATNQFSKIEIAGPGFLNLSLEDGLYRQTFAELQAAPLLQKGESKKVVVEYISANPTGPLHIGNARGGPIGETISRTLEALGTTVHRDFYVNDVGGQASKFARSVLHFYKLKFGVESEAPEGGYPEHVVAELVEAVAQQEGDSILKLPADQQEEAMRKVAIDLQVSKIQATADRMGITFDTWSLQSELLSSGRSAATLAILEEKHSTIEKDGAIWLKSGIQEDDRETVLVKSDKTTTYFLDDIAFYRMKLDEWENDYGVCVLGANHFGHIPRMQAGMAGIGIDPNRYKGTLYQQVQLKEGTEKIKMSKREGNFVTADQVLDEIPRDVFTWFMLSKAAETHLDFDLQLAKDTSEKNPIYYVQYAHARIHSVLAKAGEPAEQPAEPSFNREERALLRHVAAFPSVVVEVATSFRTHLLPTYLYELATRYHHFYAHHRVMSDNAAEASVRIALSKLTAQTLREGLQLMNIEAQDHM